MKTKRTGAVTSNGEIADSQRINFALIFVLNIFS